MKYDALIFDIDGTLWDACAASTKGWNQALEKANIPLKVTTEQLKNVTGKPYKECVKLVLPGLLEANPELLQELDYWEKRVIKSEGGTFYDGVIEGIRELEKSHKIFLVSNCQDWYLLLFLELSGLKPHLSGYDCNGMSNLPKSEMLTRLKNKHNLENAVYIGDTEGDRTAAEAAKMDFVHAAYGFGKITKEATNYNSFQEILEHLNN